MPEKPEAAADADSQNEQLVGANCQTEMPSDPLSVNVGEEQRTQPAATDSACSIEEALDSASFSGKLADAPQQAASSSGKLGTAVSAATQAGGALEAVALDGGADQRFNLSAAPLVIPGLYSCLSCADMGARMTVAGESVDEHAAITAAAATEGLSQKFTLAGANSVGGTLRSAVSNFYVAAENNVAVQTGTRTGWSIAFATSGSRRGLVFAQPEGLGLTFTASGGASLTLATLDYSMQQAFLPLSVRLVEDGVYFIANAASGKVLDIEGGRRAAYTNVQQFDQNDTNAQKFSVTRIRNNLYSICNVATARPLGVWGSNAEMLNWTGESNQFWMVDPGAEFGWRDGYVMRQNTHAVTLAGYDRNSNSVLVSDPLDGSVWRDVGRFAWLYDVMGRQAVIIE